jgi:hypothetical protein
MKKTTLIISLFYISFTYSQVKNKIIFPNFKDFTLSKVQKNKKWKILKEATGYLNKDSILDFVLILQSTNKNYLEKDNYGNEIEHSYPRIILLLINNKTILQNNTFIARGNEGGMSPYLEPIITIKNKQLIVFCEYTRAYTEYVFEYKNCSMLLVKARDSYVHSVTGNFEYNIYDFVNKEVTVETGNISKVNFKKKTVFIKNLNIRKLSKLKKMHEWEVLEGKYL